MQQLLNPVRHTEVKGSERKKKKQKIVDAGVKSTYLDFDSDYEEEFPIPQSIID